MMYCTLGTIKPTTNIQVFAFIFILFCCPFCDYDIIFISMIIVKEIILSV